MLSEKVFLLSRRSNYVWHVVTQIRHKNRNVLVLFVEQPTTVDILTVIRKGNSHKNTID